MRNTRNKIYVATSPYYEEKAKPITKTEIKEQQKINTCLNCEQPYCRGYCEIIKGSRA